MGRHSSDSSTSPDRRRSGKKSKKKSRSRRRSRSSSYDYNRRRDSRRRSRSKSRSSERSRRSRSVDDKRRRQRSRSSDSYRSRRSNRRSRSLKRRTKSRSSSREDKSSRRRRSRSDSREKSTSKRGKKSKKRSRSRERLSVKKEQPKPKDPCEDIPGFSEMTPAQQSRLRVQAAFKAVEANSPITLQRKASPAPAETTLDQIDRAQVIADIEDEGFMPTHFSSSRSNKPKDIPKVSSFPTSSAEQEDYHEMAIFGNSNALGLDEKSKKQISDATEAVESKKIKWKDRDPKSLAHPNLHISKEDADKRWIERLTEMRAEALKSMG